MHTHTHTSTHFQRTNLIAIFHKSYTLINSICEMLKQFTKTICHYPLVEIKKWERESQLLATCSSFSFWCSFLFRLIFHLSVSWIYVCLGAPFIEQNYTVSTIAEQSCREKKKWCSFILTYWNGNKSFFSSGFTRTKKNNHLLNMFLDKVFFQCFHLSMLFSLLLSKRKTQWRFECE